MIFSIRWTRGTYDSNRSSTRCWLQSETCKTEGSELCNPRLSPLVVKYIGELKEERLRKHEVTYEGHVAELARLREAALKKGLSSAVNAEANRGKAAGLYIDRKIIKTGKLEDIRTGIRSKNETTLNRLRTDN